MRFGYAAISEIIKAIEYTSPAASKTIFVIGLLLVVLSYKFEAVKDVMLHGMNPEKKS